MRIIAEKYRNVTIGDFSFTKIRFPHLAIRLKNTILGKCTIEKLARMYIVCITEFCRLNFFIAIYMQALHDTFQMCMSWLRLRGWTERTEEGSLT